MHFVETYRQISRAPAIRPRQFRVAPWADEVAAIVQGQRNLRKPAVRHDGSSPKTLMIDADPDLLFQVLINLLRNAAEAACDA